MLVMVAQTGAGDIKLHVNLFSLQEHLKERIWLLLGTETECYLLETGELSERKNFQWIFTIFLLKFKLFKPIENILEQENKTGE